MIDIIKKAMLTGVGIAAISLDKAEEISKELIEQGNISEQEGKKLVKEMMEYAEKSKEQMGKQVESLVAQTLKTMDVARKSDIDELRETINELKQGLNKNGAGEKESV